MPTGRKTYFNLPVDIWLIGLVGFLINLSTIMVFSIMPVFMSTELGVTDNDITMIDGIVEFLAQLCRILSGALGDILHNRKLILVCGYSLATFVKPLFAVVATGGGVFFIRAIDRVSNGLQASPRDALIADLAPLNHRGASFGLGKSLKAIGSVVGAFLVYLILEATNNNYRLLFNLATIPALIGLILFIIKIKEPRHRDHFKVKVDKKGKKFRWDAFKELSKSYWKIIALSIVIQFPHFSESALTLRAKNSGLEASITTFVMMLFNIGQFAIAYPLGRLSDRIQRHYLLLAACVFMIGANMCLAYNINHTILFSGVVLWGAYLAITQSILVAMISDVTPQYIRGTAFGIYYLITGLVYLSSTHIANQAKIFNEQYQFFTSAAMTVVAIIGIFIFNACKSHRDETLKENAPS